MHLRLVVPRVGAWIETSPNTRALRPRRVAPRVGAWNHGDRTNNTPNQRTVPSTSAELYNEYKSNTTPKVEIKNDSQTENNAEATIKQIE